MLLSFCLCRGLFFAAVGGGLQLFYFFLFPPGATINSIEKKKCAAPCVASGKKIAWLAAAPQGRLAALAFFVRWPSLQPRLCVGLLLFLLGALFIGMVLLQGFLKVFEMVALVAFRGADVLMACHVLYLPQVVLPEPKGDHTAS